MTTEFSKKQNKTETVYTLESATGGGTSAGSIASVSSPVGGVRKRGDNLIAQEADKKQVVPTSKPRNFVAKNASTGGAGAHVDKKRAQKQGNEKHKKPFAESADEYTTEKQIKTRIRQIMYDRKLSGTDSSAGELNQLKARLKGLRGQKDVAEGSNSSPFNQEQNLRSKSDKELADLIQFWNRALKKNPEHKIAREQLGLIKMIRSEQIGKKNMSEDHEIQMASSELQSIAKNAVNLLDLVRRYSEREGLQAWQQSKITKSADYLNSVLQSISGEQHDLGMAENFKDGKNPGRKGLAKRSGVNTGASVSSLRNTARHSSGEKQRMAHWLANMKSGRAKTEGLSWSALDDGLSMEDKLSIFEQYHTVNSLIKSIDENKKKYFLSLFSMSDTPVKKHRYIVVPLSLVNNKIMKLDTPSHMEFLGESDDQMVFRSSTGTVRYPSKTMREISIFNTFTFSSKAGYDKFRSALALKFDTTLPNIELTDQGDANITKDQGVAEGSTQKYEMMLRNGQVKKFVAKDDADARRIAAGHGAKSVIRMKGNVPGDKIGEQGVAEAKKKGLYYYVNKRKQAGISRSASNPKAPTDQAWRDAAKTAKEEDVAEGERTMSRAAKGYEKYGKKGMQSLAKAGREGASEKKLDAIRDKHDNYNEAWSQKYKGSINCSHPKGFSQKAHCAGKKKHNEDLMMEMTCPDCGMCETHGNHMMEIKQRLDAKCWKGKHKEGTKIKGGIRVNNCVPNESSDAYVQRLQVHLESTLMEKIPANAPVDVYIKDFEKSNAPQFRGKTKAKRRQMAVAASYAAKNPSKKK